LSLLAQDAGCDDAIVVHVARRKNLSRRTDEYIQLRVVAKLILAEKSIAHR
jgi:hypothetical protein